MRGRKSKKKTEPLPAAVHYRQDLDNSPTNPAGTSYGRDCSTGAHYTKVIAEFDPKAGHHHYIKACIRCEYQVKAFCATCGYLEAKNTGDDLKYFKRKGDKAS